MQQISEFRGEYSFLSNYFDAPVLYNGLRFKNSEAAFQAQKCPERATEFCNLSPMSAKRMGRAVPLRSDWNKVRIAIMKAVVLAKFQQNKKLKRALLATQDAILIEGNTWNDTFWGVCRGRGENNLGKILMEVRNELGSNQ